MTLTDQIAAARRELGMRRRVYPRWVTNGKMTQATADHARATEHVVALILRGCGL